MVLSQLATWYFMADNCNVSKEQQQFENGVLLFFYASSDIEDYL
jgi:hypothetical protein